MSYDVGNPAFDCCRELESLRKENARLTLAASESVRTLQGEIEQMKAESVCWETGHTAEMGARLLRVHCPMCTDAAIKTIQQERDALRDELEKIVAIRPQIELLANERDAFKNQVTALREALTQLRVLPNNIDPPEFCWCGWQADLKNHSYVCQFARRTIAALPQDRA